MTGGRSLDAVTTPRTAYKDVDDLYSTILSILRYLSEVIRDKAKPSGFWEELDKKKIGKITTEIRSAPEFYYAEDYHQQYLGKNPNGYCGLGGTGVSCPVGIAATA